MTSKGKASFASFVGQPSMYIFIFWYSEEDEVHTFMSATWRGSSSSA